MVHLGAYHDVTRKLTDGSMALSSNSYKKVIDGYCLPPTRMNVMPEWKTLSLHKLLEKEIL